VLLGMCFGTDPKLSLFTFIVVPLAVLPLARFTKWLKRVSKGGQNAQGQINAVGYEALAGIRVVQSCQGEAHELKRLDAAAGRYYADMCVSYFIRAVRTPTMETLGSLALAGLLALLGYQVQSQGADPAHYISFFAAIVLMYDPLKKLGNVSDYLAAGAASSERLFEVIDHPNAITDTDDCITLPRFNKSIVFKDVHFAYDNVAKAKASQTPAIRETPVLHGVDLTLEAGQVVALVGASGAGKSTLAHLLPRFYDITGGSLQIDGHDICDISLASLRQQISVVSQDTFLFNTSVADNIAYARPDATPAEVRRAAEAAYADEFIHRLPEGYDTLIGERGVTLSGGQRQRLAIARALLRNTPLLILDEATSSLDIESERYVQAALDALMRGRTALVIAHRLSTVRHADFIAVLRDGRVVEQGAHDALIARGGEYARLYAMQFADVPEVVGGQPPGSFAS
jgi:ATP-binding cassette, subfamily B, bacterial MsbA